MDDKRKNRRKTDRINRVVEKEDGWYFLAREGDLGPYETEAAAKYALSRYILEVQLDVDPDEI